MDNFSKEELEEMVADCWSMRELARRCGYSSIGNNNKTIQSRLDEFGISTEHFTGRAKDIVRRNEQNVFCENSKESQAVLRRWYTKGKYTEYKCSICGMRPFWNGKELVLTLDHINGKNHDNRLENLRWICPNCDRQLDTFGFKNPNKKQSYASKKAEEEKEHKKNYCVDCGKEIQLTSERCPTCYYLFSRTCERPSREELKSLIRNTPFTKIGERFGVTDNAIRKWCKSEGLPFRVSDIKQFSDEDWERV